MNRFQQITLFIARILICLVFIVAGVSKILNWSEMEEGLVMTFCHWHTELDGFHASEKFVEFLISSAPILLAAATFLELVGGILVLFGVKMRWGAFLLLLFLIPVTFIYHDFWFYSGDRFHVEFAMFMKNLSIIGTLLLLTFGPAFKTKKG